MSQSKDIVDRIVMLRKNLMSNNLIILKSLLLKCKWLSENQTEKWTYSSKVFLKALFSSSTKTTSSPSKPPLKKNQDRVRRLIVDAIVVDSVVVRYNYGNMKFREVLERPSMQNLLREILRRRINSSFNAQSWLRGMSTMQMSGINKAHTQGMFKSKWISI